jgi:alpha-tubulin suppressor-like RCC1 family protein
MVWGDDTARQFSDAPDGDLKAVVGGSVNGLALRQDGTPVLWGVRQTLPDGSSVGLASIPAGLAAEKFRAIAIGRDDAVLIRQDGTLEPVGGEDSPLKPAPAGSYSAVAVAAVHAVAIANDGKLKAWGSDNYPPPNGPLTGLLNAPEGGPFKAVDARVLYSLALHEDGTLYGWGHGAHGVYVLEGWTATPEDPAIFYQPGQSFKAIAAGNVHALAIKPDGTVTGWPDGTVTGLETQGALEAPAHVRFKAVAAGWGFSIGLQTDGTLWGWGTPVAPRFPGAQAWTFDSQGWTRFGDTGQYYVPGERFKLIAAAAFHIMAVTAGH